ncbi:MAG: DUF4407 domain-containing protein [Gemmatimonadetes bacterium]|nr:DUF4407 domain-containing protein [Gemmatimonadota bacterium]
MSHPNVSNSGSDRPYQCPTPSAVSLFMWRCAGADEAILRRCNYSEHVKAACMGGIVLATGVLAFIAMTFAMWTIFSKSYGDNAIWFAPAGRPDLGPHDLQPRPVHRVEHGEGDGLETISGSEIRECPASADHGVLHRAGGVQATRGPDLQARTGSCGRRFRLETSSGSTRQQRVHVCVRTRGDLPPARGRRGAH